MIKRYKHTGVTLTELAVVIATIALLTAIGLPAIRALLKSFESDSGARDMISAALSGARAIAAKEQRYAGVRFQQDTEGNQYMIHIVHDPEKTGLSSGFRAVEGLKPMKLPENSRVADLAVRTNHNPNPAGAQDIGSIPLQAIYLDDTNPQNLGPDGKNIYLTDVSSFSIIFAPNGKIVIHRVRVRNRDGVYQPDNSIPAKMSRDDVFNSPENISNLGVGLFIQDDYPQLGLGEELSVNRIILYDKTQFVQLNALGRFNYLNTLKPIYISPYTGTIIKTR
jgi:hypothetical protein